MHREIAQSSEPEKGSGIGDLYAGHVPLLGETHTKWILKIAQLYIIDSVLSEFAIFYMGNQSLVPIGLSIYNTRLAITTC